MTLTKAEVMRRYRARHPGRSREQNRRWRQRNLEQQRARERRVQRRMRIEHPERQAARDATKRLPREPCEVCGTTEHIHAHHDDYDKPLKVRWLCRRHHGEVHTGQGGPIMTNPIPRGRAALFAFEAITVAEFLNDRKVTLDTKDKRTVRRWLKTAPGATRSAVEGILTRSGLTERQLRDWARRRKRLVVRHDRTKGA